MVLLDRSKVPKIPINVDFKFKLHFKLKIFLKMPSVCALDFLYYYFPQSSFLQHGGITPEELLSGALFLREVALTTK
jgi:hypothetical protein